MWRSCWRSPYRQWQLAGSGFFWRYAITPTRRLRQWLGRKHKVSAGKYVRFPDERLWQEYGLARLALRTTGFPWAKA